jgi:hypothetical protein
MHASVLAVLLALGGPAVADPIHGLDDPAFRLPFDRALQGDDPTALKDLHAAAEAGNQAAILALPMVSDWLRSTLPFSERKSLARINGVPMAEAFASADPVAALWAMGDIATDTDTILDRAFALYDAGEPDKATQLFMTWANQTGGYHPQPDSFFSHPTPPWAMAYVLWGRMQDTVFATEGETDALILSRIAANDPAVWIALAAYSGLHRSDPSLADPARLATIFAAAGIPQDVAIRRMQDALPVLRAIHRVEPILSSDDAIAATAAFHDEPGFQPLLTLCATECPKTQDQCAAAYVAGFGHPYGRATLAQPLTSLISTADFFATPRGRLILLRSAASQLDGDPANAPPLAAARKVDACLADAVLAAVP